MSDQPDSRDVNDAPEGRIESAQAAVKAVAASLGDKVGSVKDDATKVAASARATAREALHVTRNLAQDGLHEMGRSAKGAASATAEALRSAKATAITGAVGTAQSAVSEAQGRLEAVAGSTAAFTALARDNVYEKWIPLGKSLRQRIRNDVSDSAEALVEEAVRFLKASSPIRERIARSAVAVGIATAAAYKKIAAASPQFAELSPALKAKIALAGGRGEWRSVQMAESFFEESVPAAIRNLGEPAVLEFLGGKHASHVQSVENAPVLAMESGNVLWEASRSNLERGSANMTGLELAKANVANLVDAAGIVAVHAIEAAAVAGCIGLALETVVAAGENLVYVYHGERSARAASADVAKKAGKQGAYAAAGGAVVSAAMALGAGPALSAMAPVLMTIGGTVYVIGAARRISSAFGSGADRRAVEDLLLAEPVRMS